MAKIHTTIDGDTVDGIAYAHYGRHRGTTEAVYEANRGLADLPMVLPAGVNITLPDLPETPPIVAESLYD